MSKCPNCGTINDDTNQFCQNCGSKISQSQNYYPAPNTNPGTIEITLNDLNNTPAPNNNRFNNQPVNYNAKPMNNNVGYNQPMNYNQGYNQNYNNQPMNNNFNQQGNNNSDPNNLNIMGMIPEASLMEINTIKSLVTKMSPDRAKSFLMDYSSQRKSYSTALILCILGLFLPLGIFRFYVGNIGIGVIWLLTFSLMWLGAIIDIFTYKSTTEQVNIKLAHQLSFTYQNI